MSKEINKKEVKTVVKSPTPYYVVAAVWFAGCLYLPMYRLSSYLILAGITLFTFAYCQNKMDKVIVEVVEEFDSPLVRETVLESRKLIAQLKDANVQITNKKLSDQIERFVTITEAIVESVVDRPEKIGNIRKFMNYYLPECINLLNRYGEFEKIKSPGVQTKESMEKISNIMDVMEKAFVKLKESQYDLETLELNADISVLSQMIKQDGFKD